MVTHFLFGTKISEVPGSETTIDCLWCEKQTVAAQTRERTEWLTLFHLVPIFRFRTVFVRCQACARDMIAKCSLEEAERGNPMVLRPLLFKRVSFVGKMCIVLGILFCWAPFIGLIPALIGFFYRKKFGVGMKRASYVGLVISSLTTALGIAGALLSKHT